MTVENVGRQSLQESGLRRRKLQKFRLLGLALELETKISDLNNFFLLVITLKFIVTL